MTVSSPTNRVLSFGNGVTTVWPFSFPILAAEDLTVIVTDPSGNSTTLLPAQYAAAGIGSASGGSVTYPLSGPPLAVGWSILLKRIVPYTQTADIQNQGGFFPDVIETALDRVVFQIQQIAEFAGRNLLLPDAETGKVIPSIPQRIGKFLGFDAGGNPVASSGTGNDPDLRTDLAAPGGSALLGFIQTAVGAVARTLRAKLFDTVSVRDFGAVGDGVADDTVAIQAALTAYKSVYFPAATYKISAPLVGRSGQRMYGDGDGATIITTALDIQMVNCVSGTYRMIIRDIQFDNSFPVSDVAGPTFTATTTNGSSLITAVSSTTGLYKGMRITGAGIPPSTYIRYIDGTSIRLGNLAGAYVNATASGTGVSMSTVLRRGPTKHHIYLNNAGWTRIHDCYFFNRIDDSDYHPDNLGGIWFDRDTLSQFFINEVSRNWIDRGEIRMGTSDSNIDNNHVWGIGMDAAIRLNAPGIACRGNNASNGQIAAIVVSATVKEPFGSLNHNIVGNNIDSGSRWQDGYGISMTRPNHVAVTGNRINICSKAGIYMADVFGVAIVGNQFNNNNLDGLAYSDVEIASLSFSSSNYTVSGNSFGQDSLKTPTRGWAIRELPGPFFPQGATYANNSIGLGANYQSPAFSIATPISDPNVANVSGNIGGNMEAGISGTFTPILVGSGPPGAPTYTSQYGRYSLSNKVLTFRCGLSISALGGLAGNVSVQGLPAVTAAGAGEHASASIGLFGGVTLPGGRTQLSALIDENTASARLMASGGSGLATADITNTAITPASFGITIAGSYRVA